MLQSEIDARISRLATTYMEESGLVELQTVSRMAGEDLGMWEQFSIVFKNDGERAIEKYHCPSLSPQRTLQMPLSDSLYY